MDHGLRETLAAATGEGILSAEQADRLVAFLETGTGSMSPVAAVEGAGLSASREVAEANLLEDSEMPRFVRGFHDVLITIGLIIALSGLAGLTHAAVALLASIVLSEVLVRRQRLALPAVTLTIAYIAASTSLLVTYLVKWLPENDTALQILAVVIGYAVLIVPFYWRYRVPIALAGLVATLTGSGTLLVAALASRFLYGSSDFSGHPVMTAGVCLAGGVVLFAQALRFDLKDRLRRTLRSDVAFWLHLVAAPAMLYSLFAFIHFQLSEAGIWNIGSLASVLPGTVIAVVTVFVLIGLAIDRRAFVTSGLMSLGFAFASLIAERQIEYSQRFFLVLLVLGAVVLGIGVLWPHLRRLLVGLLPQGLQNKLPPLR